MLVVNGLVFYEGSFQKKDIRIADGKFVEISEVGSLVPEALEEVLNADGKYILPGLVDVHSHGRVGEDYSFATLEGLQKMSDSYASCGVTTIIGTTMTNDPIAIEKSMECMNAFCSGTYSGAKLLGINMEGPFLGKDKKGAHDEQYLECPNVAWFDKMQKASGNKVCIITVDPRLDGTDAFIEKCRKEGVFVSLGHTSCDYERAIEASKIGADHVTHLFNAMNPIHHRKPGLIGAAMDTGMFVELICDGIHLHPSIIRMMFAMHPDQMLLISDSMQAAGLPDGQYELGGLPVFVKNGMATQEDGTIAGSTTNVFDAMVNVIRFGVPVEQAVNSASYLPAKSVGLEEVTGSIKAERNADFLVVDKDWNLEQVYIDGTLFTK